MAEFFCIRSRLRRSGRIRLDRGLVEFDYQPPRLVEFDYLVEFECNRSNSTCTVRPLTSYRISCSENMVARPSCRSAASPPPPATLQWFRSIGYVRGRVLRAPALKRDRLPEKDLDSPNYGPQYDMHMPSCCRCEKHANLPKSHPILLGSCLSIWGKL